MIHICNMFWHKNSERHVNVTDATYKCYGTECGDTRETAREDVRFKKSVKRHSILLTPP